MKHKEEILKLEQRAKNGEYAINKRQKETGWDKTCDTWFDAICDIYFDINKLFLESEGLV